MHNAFLAFVLGGWLAKLYQIVGKNVPEGPTPWYIFANPLVYFCSKKEPETRLLYIF